MRDCAAEGIVCDSVGNSGDRNINQRNAITRDCKRFVGRVRDGLARGDERRIDKCFAYRDIASNVEGAGARGESGG